LPDATSVDARSVDAAPAEPPPPNAVRRTTTWITTHARALTGPVVARAGRAPLRVRLVAILAVLVLTALTISGVASVEVVRNLLLRQVDSQLSRTLTFIERTGIPPTGSNSRLPTSAVGQVQADGQLPQAFGTNPFSDEGAPEFPTMTSAMAKAHGTRPFTVGSTTGSDHWRVTYIPVTIQNADGTQSPGSLAVAIPLTGVEGPVHTLWLIELGVGIVVLGSMVALAFVVVRRSLRPLHEVERVAGAIAAGDLSRRVPEAPVTTEVGSVSRSLNAMLAQIEHAFDVRAASETRMRQFVADASHELRTPLAAVRGYAELYRQGAVREPDDVASAMRRIEDEAARMGVLVEDLLLLARLDEQRPARTERVDVTVLAADAVQDARAIAPDRAITLVGLGGPLGSAEIAGDEPRLRQVVTNLVANALHHTPAGTPIEVAVGPATGDPGVVLEVRDHGLGVDPQQAARVFERFFRADPSRTRGRGGGTGLGLAIVAAIVSAHDGRVGVARTPGGGATFIVELPAAALPANSQT
jgi:two-component system OmpR family sensor kinase